MELLATGFPRFGRLWCQTAPLLSGVAFTPSPPRRCHLGLPHELRSRTVFQARRQVAQPYSKLCCGTETDAALERAASWGGVWRCPCGKIRPCGKLGAHTETRAFAASLVPDFPCTHAGYCEQRCNE